MNLDLFSLYGKNAVVTGSSKGIGAAIALAFAEAGANVTLHGNTTSPDVVLARVRNTGVKAAAVQGDLSNPEVCRELVDRTVGDFGSLAPMGRFHSASRTRANEANPAIMAVTLVAVGV